ncbi:hypothetical protein EI94DRAFT_1789338 [Lactarius quietus]|nr:hypothetical protein EI94DRAFT_1789338 [Lactarius quietus]
MYNRRSHNSNCNDHANVINTWPNALDIEENAATKETEANEPDISQAVHIVITAPIIDLIREPEVQNNLHGSKTPPLQHMSPLFLLLKICQIIPSRATTFIMDILRYLTGTKTHALMNSNKRLVLFEFTIANNTSQFHYDTTSGFVIPIDIATISRVSHSQLEEPPIQLNLTPAEAEYLATAQAAKDRSNLRQNAEPSLEPLSSPFRTPHLFLSDAKFVTLPIVSNASHSKTDMSPDATEAAHSQKTIFYKAIGSPIYASDTTCINTVYSSPSKTLPKHKVTKKDIASHPLAAQLQSCESPNAILTVLRAQIQAFDQSQSTNDKLTTWLDSTVNVLYAFSSTLNSTIGLVFPPSSAIFAGIGVLLQAIKDVRASQDALVDLFGRMEYFFKRLENYLEVRPTLAMTDIIVKIMVEVLSILEIVTKEIEQGRFKKYLKKLIGRKDVEDALQRLHN